ncbi:MAG TPA: FAD-dependent oxidoreductase, partial [Candidatus Glassbacteria bacterium]|nr:FAD-dependent oxidoreductase [Candidatus Glassbacteria bacterium]
EREPAVAGDKALISPNGAIVDSTAFVRAVAEDARRMGAEFILNAEVTALRGDLVQTTAGDFRCRHLVNCAGLHSDRIAAMAGAGAGYRIIPFRGEYMEIAGLPVRSMVYQAPDLNYPFLGVHLTRTVTGEVLAGPTAMLSLGREAYDKQIVPGDTLALFASPNFWRLATSGQFLRLVWHNGRISFSDRAFLKEIRTLAPSVERRDIRPYRSGIRAQLVDRRGRLVDDLLVEFRPASTHVLNAVSPGMTAALPFAEYVVDKLLASGTLSR